MQRSPLPPHYFVQLKIQNADQAPLTLGCIYLFEKTIKKINRLECITLIRCQGLHRQKRNGKLVIVNGKLRCVEKMPRFLELISSRAQN